MVRQLDLTLSMSLRWEKRDHMSLGLCMSLVTSLSRIELAY